MDERYVFEDKFAIANHEECWQDLIRQVNEGDFPAAFFSKLAQKTRELLLVYDEASSVPKELLRLISLLYRYTECTMEGNTLFSLSRMLIADMLQDFGWSHPLKTGEQILLLGRKCYTINVETFDLENMAVKPYKIREYSPPAPKIEIEEPPKLKRARQYSRKKEKKHMISKDKWKKEDE